MCESFPGSTELGSQLEEEAEGEGKRKEGGRRRGREFQPGGLEAGEGWLRQGHALGPQTPSLGWLGWTHEARKRTARKGLRGARPWSHAGQRSKMRLQDTPMSLVLPFLLVGTLRLPES